ncbi:TPA: restriction endonuclease subunit S [Streptococcus suis]|nr:restriction endonuclease subunit S [Streptococcus suis]
MKTNNNIPAYRFQGYTDAWELRKLGEVIEQQIREVDKPDDAYRRLSVRSHAKGTFHQLVEDPSTVAMDKLYIVKADDLIVNITFAWEHAIAVANLYDDGLLVSHRFPTYRAKCNSDIKYIKYLVSQEDFRRKLEFISPGGAGRNRVMNKKDFINLKAIFPSLPEQEAIGTFFSTLDQHITLHQRKLDTLKEQKKTYLKLLFPAKGQTKPVLRFRGFEDDWEEVKLGEVAKMYQPQTITGGDLIEEGIPVFGANGYIGYYSDCNHVTDQVTISARGEGTGTPNFVKAPVWITGNSMVINVDENKDIDKKFLYSNFLAYDFKKYVSGGAQPQLTRDVLSLVKISIPSLPEQEAIGTFFQNLDQEIAQVEDKLASLKEMKKTLLRKLFV